ncbi:hypothetical protein FFI94_017110 [Rhodococcus sp. KBS0724]|uniref:SCO6745 family protein n=1 Tax=Rhodococcus sp. KBS0724 TaxID=1179674 RepID=UPI00110DA5AE|nr:hypothetical protein [Rhodococcus sp. KBS0724]TSD47681.1 hypothetical protein FFI94_017110 [Rhodococcus sp. KBS0724]
MDPQTAGKTGRTLELLHSLSYFVPETEKELVALGLEPGRMVYFAGRAAPLGTPPATVVTSAFYNFNPELVASVIPRAWDLAKPSEIVAARYRAIDAAYVRLLCEDVTSSPDMAEAAELVSIAARNIPGVEGRPLYAGWASVEWPTVPHVAFWHALTLLREYRGDGHIAALQTAGLNGLEALITHTATGIGFQKKFAQNRRGWSTEQWEQAVRDLQDRELLDRKSGALTEDGQELRDVVEDLTDDLALAPWDALGESGADRLLELAAPWRAALIEQEVFPAALFGPRFGNLR